MEVMKQEEDFDPCAPEDARRKKNGFVSRHRVRRMSQSEPPAAAEQLPLRLAESSPASDGFATVQRFYQWRLSVLKQLDPGRVK